ncbi:MAG: type II secretion system protein M [Actinomycetota bacterium]|nr:type II secretion system protein M [Actinomycetota bacterium]
MDLSPAQQRAVFVLIVVVLAALGYWLIWPKVTHSSAHAQATTSPASAVTSPAAPDGAGSSGPAQDSAPPVTASPAVAGNVNIYSWLPFTQQELSDAAAVTVKVGVDYNTFTYTETAAGYVAAMKGLITGPLATILQASYATPGVASLRSSEKQVSTGTATITSLRAFGPSSLTFIVTAGQRLVSARGTSNGSTQYAITVTGSGRSWMVDDIELKSAGNS